MPPFRPTLSLPRRVFLPLPHQLPPVPRTYTTLKTPQEISDYLSTPTWSVRDTLFPPQNSTSTSSSPHHPPGPSDKITPAKLHHLLRLSALPLPSSPEEESRLLDDLRRQLMFVRHVQSVDTRGVEPMVAVRDETEQGRRERTVGLEDRDIREVFEGEVKVGRRGRVKTIRDGGDGGDEGEGEGGGREKRDWDPLERAPRVVGRYIAVDTAKD